MNKLNQVSISKKSPWLCTLTELKSHLREIILFSAQVREKKEILRSKAPFKKHRVTKQRPRVVRALPRREKNSSTYRRRKY